VVVPCYNEEANIARMIEDTLATLARLSDRYEVIVSNDGSEDGTREIAESYARRFPGVVRVLDHHPNAGYGHALTAGLRAARYGWVFVTDGDCQFVMEEMERLVPFLPDHDIVTGYRAKRQDGIHRRLYAKGWNSLGRVALGVAVRDVNCAFRFYRRALLDAMTIRSRGAMVGMEICAKAQRLGARIREVEVTHRPRLAGRSTGGRPRVILRAFRELLAVYLELKGVAHRRVRERQSALTSVETGGRRESCLREAFQGRPGADGC
jgi:glycosyltransferase involved in cell wall biosynthesis